VNRRGVLRGLGGGALALALPFARVLRASAQDRRPLRFVSIFTPNGTMRSEWGHRRSETQFDLRAILEPFAPLRDRILVLEGLDMSVARHGPGGQHQQGPGAVLTGMPLLPGSFCGGIGCRDGTSGWAAGPSLDQVIADHLVGSTRLRSLELGVRVFGSNNRYRISYRAASAPVPPDDDPFHVYETLFAAAAADPRELERRRVERRSVLDLVRGDLGALSRELGAEHRAQLDAHLESIREVERQLDAARVDPSCASPELGDRFDHRSTNAYPRVSRLQLDLLATALACDATRVATVLCSGGASYQSFPWLGFSDQHHNLSHEGDGNADAARKLVQINAWYAAEIARFCERLAAIPEGDGTLLDHTIVFWCNEISKGNTHSHDDMWLLVAGGSRAGVRLGRWLRFEDRPHADLLVSFGRAMGLPIERFGHEGYCTGPLVETGITV
jgi:hypothetical protein